MPTSPAILPIYVLVCTIDMGIQRVAQVLQPMQKGIYYVVSWQQTADESTYTASPEVEHTLAILKQRTDVTLTTLEGRGLCRNRNHAIATAVSLLPSPLTDAIFITADDDEQLFDTAFGAVRELYLAHERLDIALLRAYGSTNHTPLKPYPTKMMHYANRPRTYYPSSVEMTFRSRLWQCGMRFDERFGLGADFLCAGEEEIFLTDAQRKGLNAWIVPTDLCMTNPATTGDNALRPEVLASKGAIYAYQLNLPAAMLRAAREALSLGVRRHANPIRLFRHLLQGIKYIRS